jgi:hypothetical protein
VAEDTIPLPRGDFLVYHWSPSARRFSILERGLRIRQESSAAPGLVRYPYVAFALDPIDAWEMSGQAFGEEVISWDLWAVRASALGGFEIIPTDDGEVRELRSYRSIPARRVTYIATRERR